MLIANKLVLLTSLVSLLAPSVSALGGFDLIEENFVTYKDWISK